MKFILGILLFLLIAAVLFSVTVIVSSLFVTKEFYTENSPYYRFLLMAGSFIAIKGAGIKIVVSGRENIPKCRFLLVGNHRSNFDPIITWYALAKEDIAFVSKPSNFNIPFYGRIIRKCCFMPIDRENPRNAITTINKSASLIKSGAVSVGIYPEGTRSKNSELLPFHNGVFKIAQKAASPIVIASVIGTEKVKDNYFRRKTVVYLDIAEPISAEEVASLSTSEIGDKVREILEKNISKGE